MESIANSTTVLIEKGILAQLSQLALEPAKSAISLQKAHESTYKNKGKTR